MNSLQSGKTVKAFQLGWLLKLWRSATVKTDVNPTASPEEMHQDHKQWRSEHVGWLKDITHWLREHRRANGLIYRIEQVLPDLDHTLNLHADQIRQHEDVLSKHERILIECEQGNTDPKRCADLLKEHLQSQQRHKQVSEQHIRFRETHMAAMVELRRLVKLLQEE